MKSLYLFPSLVTLHDLSDLDLNVCVDVMKKEKFSTHGLVKNGKSTYESGLQFLEHYQLGELKDKILECVAQHMLTAGFSVESIDIGSSWVNILGKYGSVTPHDHEYCLLSGALYIHAPENSCSLGFRNTTNSIVSFENSSDNTVKPFETNRQIFFIEPHEGLLVIFPSNMLHFTDLNQSDQRIVLSFNVNYNKII